MVDTTQSITLGAMVCNKCSQVFLTIKKDTISVCTVSPIIIQFGKNMLYYLAFMLPSEFVVLYGSSVMITLMFHEA